MFTIDFETSSRASLKKQGAHVYARHPSTKVLCMAYGDSISGIVVWPGDAKWRPVRLFDHIREGGLVEAHNAGFERAIWEAICVPQFQWPAIDPSQWRCTLAAASRLALPRGLEDVCRVLGLSEQKDMEGSKVLMKLCKPNSKGEMNTDLALLEILFKYCTQDVRAEMALGESLGEMPIDELTLWQLDQEINNRGLLIDREALRHAIVIVEKCRLQSVENLFDLADGEVTAVTQRNRVLKWIGERLPDGAPEKLDKTAVENLLKREDLPTDVRAMLELRQEGAKSSLGKLKAMDDRMNEDGRVRGNQVYHGAATGRWAGAGLQIQNFPRGSLKPHEVDFIIDDLLPTQDPAIIQAFFGDVPAAISSCLRGFIRAEEGKSFYVSDFNSIEARSLAWVAGQDDLVQAFRDGVGVYEFMASKIFEVPIEDVDKDQRFLGKSAVLGCLDGDTQVVVKREDCYKSRSFKYLIDLTTNDELWDGVNWVRHEGVVPQGRKLLLFADGIGATPDHKFLRGGYWVPWQNCHRTFEGAQWKETYDVHNSGNLNRFEIIGRSGPQIVHNCGYSMGYRKFVQSCLLVGKVVVPSLMAKKTVRMYREANPKIVQLWRDCNRECIECIKTGEPKKINDKISVDMHRGMMRILLPSSRHLHYHNPRVVKVAAPWTQLYVGEIYMPEARREALELADVEVGDYEDDRFTQCKITPKMAKYLTTKGVKLSLNKPKAEVIDQIAFWGVDSQTKRWQIKRTYGGSLTENVVQAIARDLLAAAMIRVENAGYPILATVHDEILAEVNDSDDRALEEFEGLMVEVPDWAIGCPINVEGYIGKRYKK